jgi:crotonobetainyl-CoA:carnitine CoA-transferase CaiB-like acyl-CoA transferase
VRTLDEVVRDPQAAARQMFPVIEHSGSGLFPVTGLPLRFAGTPGRVKDGAPLLGEHTREALSEVLELSEAELARLERSGVIFCASRGPEPRQ